MTGNNLSTQPAFVDPDDAPDLSPSPWREKLAAAPVRRGRPRVAQTKVSTTLRLDADILAHFRAGGDGWQSRINATLRAAIGK
ncbi:MAG: BrnA antitoxin family protein [Phyllobacteriaceae bacterium]|nr:BrnA antitoxin family protein [Phyllobacteriaceae bacterium]